MTRIVAVSLFLAGGELLRGVLVCDIVLIMTCVLRELGRYVASV